MPTCGTCTWYVAELGAKRGACHRHAPTASGWPGVEPWQFCGDHLPGDAKLTTLPGDWPDGSGLVPGHDPESCPFCQRDETAIPFHPEEL
jgi:hypothetical protein